MPATAPKTSPLDNLRVAAPCSANWDDMDGDERSRHCRECKLNVYNLSGMSRAEAEALIKEKEGNLCVRFYQRADGTILTDNCPVGLRAIRNRLAWVSAGLAAGFFIAASGALAAWGKVSGQDVHAAEPNEPPAQPPPPGAAPIQALTNWAKPPAPVPITRTGMTMGKVCISLPAATPAPTPAPATATPATPPAPAPAPTTTSEPQK